jgi:hypothetical protein
MFTNKNIRYRDICFNFMQTIVTTQSESRSLNFEEKYGMSLGRVSLELHMHGDQTMLGVIIIVLIKNKKS